MRQGFRSVLMAGLLMGLLGAAVVAGETGPATRQGSATTGPAIDWDKARQLYQKEQRQEPLTAEEKAYLDQAKAARRGGQAGPGGQAGGQSGAGGLVPQESTGMVPLTDLQGAARYKGQEGGLYGKGSNELPEGQRKAAMEAAGKVVPRDGEGKAAADGKVVMLSIGMSNTTMEFARFKQMADEDARKNGKLVIVDGAQGGKDAAAWAVGEGKEAVWQVADQRIKAAGVTNQQVEVVWIKQALAQVASKYGEFSKSADVLRDDVAEIVRLAKVRYPNLQLAYLSSRIYGGYANGITNPEPYAYEGAFAMRAVIEMQMKGEGGMGVAEGKVPVVVWGPYLWTDGTKGRKGDEVVWVREDVGPDGTHPSPTGRQKVGEMLLKFFTTDGTCKGWFVGEGAAKK